MLTRTQTYTELKLPTYHRPIEVTVDRVKSTATFQSGGISLWDRLVALPKGSVVFFDLDEVVLKNPWILMCKEFYNQRKELIDSGMYTEEQVIELVRRKEEVLPGVLLDRDIPALVEELKAREIYTVGLTSRYTGYYKDHAGPRPLSREEATGRHVKDAGVKFSQDFYRAEDNILLAQMKHREVAESVTSHGPRVEGGIGYTCGGSKGDFVKMILERRELPEGAHAVLIDDQCGNLQQFKGACLEMNLPCIVARHVGHERLLEHTQIKGHELRFLLAHIYFGLFFSDIVNEFIAIRYYLLVLLITTITFGFTSLY